MSSYMETEIKIDSYLDGGTVMVEEHLGYSQQFDETLTVWKKAVTVLYVDNRMRTETPGAVFFCYPDKGEPIQTEEDLEKARRVLVDSVTHYGSPNQLMTIARGIIWVDEQLEKIR